MPVSFASFASCASFASAPSASCGPETSPARQLLREAKRLHRAAVADAPSIALPVLRRMVACAVFPGQSLADLFRQRHGIQRKHILRTLACEAGYPSWEQCCKALSLLPAQQLLQRAQLERDVARLKRWFANEADALQFAAQHGGQVLRFGQQAVVLLAHAVTDARGVSRHE